MTTNPDREHSVTAAEANRRFSRLLRDVREGHQVVITSHGRPIARLGPFEPDTALRQSARADLLERLERQQAQDIGIWRRDELYDS